MDADQNVRWFSSVWYKDTQICGMKTLDAGVSYVFFMLPVLEEVKNFFVWLATLTLSIVALERGAEAVVDSADQVA